MNNNEDIFAQTPAGESNLFADDPAAYPIPETPKKNPRKKVVFVVVAGALLVGALAAAPLGLIKLGDSKLAAGQWEKAETFYKICLGTYNSSQRRAITAAIAAIKSGDTDTGISTLLDAGVPVEIRYNLNGGEFVNLDRKPQVFLTKPEEFGSVYKALKSYHNFNGWDFAEYSYAPEFDDAVFRVNLDANFTLTDYKISYSGLFSDIIENPQTYNYETKTITLKAPKQEGYTFIAWTGTDLTDETATVVIPQGSHGDRAYIANWKANDYVVTFEPDIKCNIKSPTVITFGTEYTLPEIEKKGYTYKGWSDGRNTYTSGIWSIPNDTTFTPVWELNTYKLTYDLAGGNLSDRNPATYTVVSEDITLKEPTRFGYSFQGWSCNGAAARKNFVIKKDTIGDMAFTAAWKGNPHTLTLDTAGGWVNSNVVYVAYGSPYTIPTPSRTGYNFLGWYNGNTKIENGVWNQDLDIKATAKWEVGKYNITLNANGGYVSPASMTLQYNAAYSLPTPVRPGFTFHGWYNGDTKISDQGTWQISSDATLTARWTGVPRTVTLQTEGGIVVNPNKFQLLIGDQYEFPIPTRLGQTFDGWYTDDGRKIPASGTWDYDYDLSLTARWKHYKVTFVTSGGTKIDPIAVNKGDRITLPTPIRTGYSFKYWACSAPDGNVAATNSIVWRWNDGLIFKAEWEANKYTVSLDPVGGTIARPQITATYGSRYSLPTPTGKDARFVGWYLDGEKLPQSGNWSIARDIKLVAHWE